MNPMKRHEFFDKMKELCLGLTFDDILIMPGYSQVKPADVCIKTRFSQHVEQGCPFVSSPMDTVTERAMAITMALIGGIGVIHRNLDPVSQAKEVKKVKSYLNGCIMEPECVCKDQTVAEVEKWRLKEDFSFQSFPVLKSNNGDNEDYRKLVGMMTRTDFDFCRDRSESVSEAMTKVEELITAPTGTDIAAAFDLMSREKKRVLPLVDGEGRITGMYLFNEVKEILTGRRSEYNVDQYGNLRVAAAVGVGNEAIRRAELLAEARVDALVIDTAHGDCESVFETLKALKKEFPDIDVVAGNIVTTDAAERLIDAGADALKVGVGPGSICSTRTETGAGCPQISAIRNCVEAIYGNDIPIIADGGIVRTGDPAKAIAAGASSVMIGGLFAGANEAPGKRLIIRGVPHKVYRGMGSKEAMEESAESIKRYSGVDTEKSQLIPQGVKAAVPCTGRSVKEKVNELVGGLRAGMGYAGAANIKEMRSWDGIQFIRVTAAGVRESSPHDVVIIEEAS